MKWNCGEECELLSFLEGVNKTISHKKLKAFLTHKQIKVNGKVVSQYNKKLHKGDLVLIDVTGHKSSVDLSILYEDKDIIVINKRSGLLTISTEKEKEKTLYRMVSDYVKEVNKNNAIFIVHRLDRETSGIILFAKNEKIKFALQDNWEKLVQVRRYVALTEGIFERESGTICTYLTENKNHVVYTTKNKKEGKEAITHYKVLKKNEAYSLVDIELETGRKNQIRVHLSEMGHPVVGDRKYGGKPSPLKRIGLHAYQLELTHPFTHKKLCFKTEIPKEFKSFIK